jgi:hypothetical protein
LDCAIAWGKQFEQILEAASYEQMANTSFNNYMRLQGHNFAAVLVAPLFQQVHHLLVVVRVVVLLWWR